jgi:hypothetical protein
MSNVRQLVNRLDLTASSPWLAALVSLLVALGSQTLLESVLPASFADLPFGSTGLVYHVAGESLWPSMAVIRVVSFAVGGAVGVLLTRRLSHTLLVMLMLVSALCTVFAQFPARSSLLGFVVWSVAAPVGIVFGAWVANARRKVA